MFSTIETYHKSIVTQRLKSNTKWIAEMLHWGIANRLATNNLMGNPGKTNNETHTVTKEAMKVTMINTVPLTQRKVGGHIV